MSGSTDSVMGCSGREASTAETEFTFIQNGWNGALSVGRRSMAIVSVCSTDEAVRKKRSSRLDTSTLSRMGSVLRLRMTLESALRVRSSSREETVKTILIYYLTIYDFCLGCRDGIANDGRRFPCGEPHGTVTIRRGGHHPLVVARMSCRRMVWLRCSQRPLGQRVRMR